MKKTQIQNKFKKHFNNHSNFMTPRVIDYKQKGNYLIEIAQGKDFNNVTIYGLTIIKEYSNGEMETMHNLNNCFYDMEELKNAISML